MTRKEAEKLVKELNETPPKWFCPLIKDMCRSDCVNFVPASVDEIEKKNTGFLHDVKDDNFTTGGYFCSNAMFICSPSVALCDCENELNE